MTCAAAAGLVDGRVLLGRGPTARGPSAGRCAGRSGAGRPARGPARPPSRARSPGGASRLTRPMARASGPVDRPPGQDQVHGPAVADQPGEPDRAQVDQRDPEAAAEDPEDGVLGGHPQVAPQGQLETAGHGVALDGGDHRLGEGHPGRAHGPRAVVGDRAAVAVGQGLQVGPGAEGAAGPGEDGDRGRAVGLEGVEGLPQGGRRWRCRRRCAPPGRSMVTTVTGPFQVDPDGRAGARSPPSRWCRLPSAHRPRLSHGPSADGRRPCPSPVGSASRILTHWVDNWRGSR